MQLTDASTELHFKIHKNNIQLHFLNEVSAFENKPNQKTTTTQTCDAKSKSHFTKKQSVWGISTKSATFLSKCHLLPERSFEWVQHIFPCTNESFITYCFIYLFLLQGTSSSSHQFLFGSLNASCLLGTINKPAELTTDKLPLLKHCWEFGNSLLHPFWCLHLYPTTADFPHSFPDFYPVKRTGLYLTGSVIQII